MKPVKLLPLLLAIFGCINSTSAETVSVNIIHPISGASYPSPQLYVAATVGSAYELQSVEASVEGHSASLVYSSSTYSNCFAGVCDPQPGWSNTISLAGLARGNKTLTVTATDVFGNSNQLQRTFVYDLSPVLTVTSPADGAVARPGLQITASATDDDPSGLVINVYAGNSYDAPLLLSSPSPLNTNLAFNNQDGAVIDLTLRAVDSAGRPTSASRRVYVQSSSNLVEVANVSAGRIVDVQSDRFLFVTPQTGPSSARIKSRTSGDETLVFAHSNLVVNGGYLSAQGATLIAGGSPFAGYTTGYGLFQSIGEAEIQHGVHGHDWIALSVKGRHAAWGWGGGIGGAPKLRLTDLQTTNTAQIPITSGFWGLSYDLAANGDVVFSVDSTGIYRYRQGIATLLASAGGFPKTDGTNVYFIVAGPSTQTLKLISQSGESDVAQGTAIDANYLLNQGWIAYSRNGGGQMQIWRRSPEGASTQLTFYGTSSTLAALAPNGDVAFYNGSKLFISKGTWPPIEIAQTTPGSGLSVFWQDGRWCATLGRSLFQIYSGTPQIVMRSGNPDAFGFDLVGASGQRLITEFSTNYANWSPVATNVITDGGGFEVEEPLSRDISGKFYRLRAE